MNSIIRLVSPTESICQRNGIIGIIGAGAWGSALATLCEKAGNSIFLWQHPNDMSPLADCQLWLVATPSEFFRETMQKSRPFWKNQPIIICSKGCEPITGAFMSEIIAELLPTAEIGALSGPQFAAEAAAGVPTGSTLAGSKNIKKAGKKAFALLFLEETNDIIGTELCGIGKNAVSIISGFYSGTGHENLRALKFTMAWNEVIKLGLAMGARLKTFSGLCGIGDLFLSATSLTSRNFSAGISFAKNKSPAGTIEGIFAIDGLLKRGEKFGIEMPVISEMQKVVKKMMNL